MNHRASSTLESPAGTTILTVLRGALGAHWPGGL